jgi:hypothetical protein
MKKLFVFFLAAVVLAFWLSSCAASKRDCQGRKHQRLSNGIVI